jgi:hypothetical protein
MMFLNGQSMTINAPNDNSQWTLARGSSLTIEAGASFPPQTIIILLGGSTLTMSGGSLDASSTITVAQQSTATLTGGSIGCAVQILQSSHLTLSGGSVSHPWLLAQESTLTVQGSGLVLDNSRFEPWWVTGTLRDGTAITLTIQIASNQNPHIVLQNR